MSAEKNTYWSYILQHVAWWSGWIILQTFVLYYNAGLAFDIAWKDALITNAILAIAGTQMIMGMRYYQPRQLLRLVSSIVMAILCTAVIRWILREIFSEETEYLVFADKWILVRGLFAWLILSVISTVSWMWFYMKEQEAVQVRKADTEKLLKDAELSSLRQQLQPHFLFNSLNSISALAGSRPEEARKMIQQLSDFLRGTIRRDDQQLVPLQDELHQLSLYLEIEKVRFGHRLQTEIETAENAATAKLPPLLLQPVVENAIKYGLYDTTGEITIRIHAKIDDGALLLQVQNPFDPATSLPQRGTGFGLNSIQRRLYLLFGRSDLLTTRQDNTIFTTEIRIPQTA